SRRLVPEFRRECELLQSPWAVDLRGRLAVAPRVHVPEERLAERDRRLPVPDEVREIRGLWNRHRTQRSQPPGSERAELTTGYPVNLDRTPTINIVATAPRESDLFRRIDRRLSVTMNIAAEAFALDRIDDTH